MRLPDLKILTVALCAAVTFAVPAQAADWDASIYFSNNKFASLIAAGLNKAGLSGGGGNNGGGVSEKTERKSYFDLMVGVELEKTKNLTALLDWGLRLDGGVGYSQLSRPDGIGIFVDPVVIHSLSAGLTVQAFVQSHPFDDRFTLETGLGSTVIFGRETYQLGIWDIRENSRYDSSFAYLRGEFSIARMPGSGPVATGFSEIQFSKDVTAFALGVKVPF